MATLQQPSESTSGASPAVEQQSDWNVQELGELCRALFSQQFLPVLIFGPKGSGKTMMLASLINYLNANPHSLQISARVVDLKLAIDGSPFPSGKKMMELAHRMYREIPHRMHTDVPAGTPKSDEPFFVPIEILSREDPDAPPIRLALMDGSGEHLNAVDSLTSNQIPYGNLRPVVQGVLEEFRSLVACIYVLPVPSEDRRGTDQDLLSDSNPPSRGRLEDLGLQNAIRLYQAVRPTNYQRYDRHLLILSQWDAQVLWQSVQFLAPHQGRMMARFRDKYQSTWASFIALSGDRAWMPYSSALVSKGGKILQTPLSRERLGMFTNRLVAWLCTAYLAAYRSEINAATERSGVKRMRRLYWLQNSLKYFPPSFFSREVGSVDRKTRNEKVQAKREEDLKRREANALQREEQLKAHNNMVEEFNKSIEKLKDQLKAIDQKMDSFSEEMRMSLIGVHKKSEIQNQKSFTVSQILIIFSFIKNILGELFEVSLST